MVNPLRLSLKVTEQKDLGVLIDNKLNFVPHIRAMVKKANRNLGIIKRTFSYIDKTIFLNLYKALVRPHLEYASTVWTVIYKRDCIAVENVQGRATRLVHCIRKLNYTAIMKELGLPSLQYRRTRADMVEVFKIMNGIDKSDKDQLFTVQSESRTRGHTQKLIKKQFRLDLRKHFFSQRVVDEWNSLSEEIITSETVNQFKARLNKFWKEKSTMFEPDCFIHTRLRMLDISSSMKEDRNGPKSRETTPGLGYSKKYNKKGTLMTCDTRRKCSCS